jgi:hypothetical protein
MAGESVIAIVATLVTGGAGLTGIIGLVKWLLERRDKLKKEEWAARQAMMAERIPQMFNAFARLYDALRPPIETYGAVRVALLKASDSGSIPRIGVPLFVTSVAEVHASHMTPMRHHWLNRPVDDVYIQFLIELLAKQSVEFSTDSLPDESVLKDALRFGLVGATDARAICHSNKEMYYLTVHFTEDVPDDPAYRETVSLIVREIKAILMEEIAAAGEQNGK